MVEYCAVRRQWEAMLYDKLKAVAAECLSSEKADYLCKPALISKPVMTLGVTAINKEIFNA